MEEDKKPICLVCNKLFGYGDEVYIEPLLEVNFCPRCYVGWRSFKDNYLERLKNDYITYKRALITLSP